MRNVKKQLEPEPPMWMRPGNTTETFLVTGYQCPRCRGNGWHWAVSPADGSPLKAPCLLCGGSGRLDAKVTVQWQPAPSADEKNRYKSEV